MDCAHRYIDKYSDPSKTVCKHEGFEGLCDSTTLGYLTRAFKRAKIYPEASGLKNTSLRCIGSVVAGIATISTCPIANLYSGKVTPGCCSSPWQRLQGCSKCDRALPTSKQCPSCNKYFTNGSCRSCYQGYQPIVPTTNHLSCIPLAAIKVEIDGIIDKITGLQYSDFVRSNIENGQTVTAHRGPGTGDLWESLVFQ